MSFPQVAASILLETGCVNFRPEDPFTLTSGRKSPVYIDCRRLISFPRARAVLMDMAVDLMSEEAGYEAFDAVAGGETAGIPFAAWISERLMLPMLYVRKKPKGFGRNARIEGDVVPHHRVLLVEDLATDGGSKLDFIRAMREADLSVAHCFVIFEYGIFAESKTSLASEGVKLHHLANWDDVVTEAQRCGHYPDETIAQVRHFLSDPDGWEEATSTAAS
ncbi:MAG: orotate phosphoribosyltransferase [Rhodospirillaceae bacterium]|nr:orotate phosphoribosyltransferase [Rhodospirillaceae bacterium]